MRRCVAFWIFLCSAGRKTLSNERLLAPGRPALSVVATDGDRADAPTEPRPPRGAEAIAALARRDRIFRMARLRAAMTLLEPGLPASLGESLPRAILEHLEAWASSTPSSLQGDRAGLFWAQFLSLRALLEDEGSTS
jgi:hypothetical protein